MSKPDSQMVIFFALAFVWFFFWNTAMVLSVCRYVKTRSALQLFWIGQAIISIVGLIFTAKVLEAVDHIESIPKGQRIVVGISLMIFSYVFPSAISMLSLRYFFPNEWKKYWEIRKSLWN